MALPPDVDPTLRAELLTAQALLAPDVRGLTYLLGVIPSTELKNQIQDELTILNRRLGLIMAVLVALGGVQDALTALYADGYPSLTNITPSQALLALVQSVLADLEAAIALLEAHPEMGEFNPQRSTIA